MRIQNNKKEIIGPKDLSNNELRKSEKTIEMPIDVMCVSRECSLCGNIKHFRMYYLSN